MKGAAGRGPGRSTRAVRPARERVEPVLASLSAEDVDRLAEALADRIQRSSSDRLLTVGQAADRLAVCPNTVRMLVSTGELVATYPRPASPRIGERQLDAFIRRKTGAR